jgi:hypothetical protein
MTSGYLQGPTGQRAATGAPKWWESIPELVRQYAHFVSHDWQAGQLIFDPQKHVALRKGSGLTAHIDRFNGNMRQGVYRLVCQAWSLSKLWDIWYLFTNSRVVGF